MSRSIRKIVEGVSKIVGNEVHIRRSLAIKEMRNFTPFMLLDHFEAPKGSGFGPHPHSGMETITYMLRGRMAHEDLTGARGILLPGDLQFMTAGKAMVHTEMPVPHDTVSEGLQLWVDLPEDLKETKPRYRDLRSFEVVLAQSQDGDVTVDVISGAAMGAKLRPDIQLLYTPVQYYHYTIKPGGRFEHNELPRDYNFFLYVYHAGPEGVCVGDSEQRVFQYQNCYFERDGDSIIVENESGCETVRCVLIGGQVLDQNVIQIGPFVHTNKRRIDQAYEDYKHGRNGFEGATTWAPTIAGGVTEEMLQGELRELVECREEAEARERARVAAANSI